MQQSASKRETVETMHTLLFAGSSRLTQNVAKCVIRGKVSSGGPRVTTETANPAEAGLVGERQMLTLKHLVLQVH